MDWRITHLESIDTTMNWARSRAKAGAPEGSIIIADTQTEGKGRRGNEWQSPTGNLYMTFIVKPDEEQMKALPFLCALAVYEAVKHDDVKLKWPNDILFKGKKLGGVLIEREGDAALCGIGINVASAPEGGAKLHDYAPDVKPSLLVRHILQAFTPLYVKPNDWRAAWTEKAAFIGENVTFFHNNSPLSGVFRGIDESGLAIIGDIIGDKAYASGEVREVRHASGY